VLLESQVEVVWDPDGIALQLVARGDPMWEPVRLDDAGQQVDVADRVRAAGVKALPRGNERHTLTFELCGETAGVVAALKRRFARALELPRGRADVLIAFEDGTQYRLHHCAVRSWPSRQTEHLTRERVQIIGGAYEEDAGSYDVLVAWGDAYYVDSLDTLYVGPADEVYLAP